jgi:ribosomal protein S18 acetylase RimI-like enzyme
MIDIRIATDDDYDDIYNICLDVHCNFYRTLIPRNQLTEYDQRYTDTYEKRRDFKKSLISNEQEVIVATDSGNVIGYMVLSNNRIKSLFISPNYQGGGVGSRLIKYAQQSANQYLELSVLSNNQPAIEFYKKHGFAIIEKSDKTYFDVNKLDMQFDIKH